MTTVRSDPDGPAADRRDAGGPIVLASRSPRRRSLLGMVVPVERLRILPPADAEEESLESLTTWREIEAAMLRIAAAKRDDVLARIAAGDRPVDAPTEQLAGRWSAIVAADTAVIAGSADGPGLQEDLTVLSQPPERDWEAIVRRWFRTHYVGRTHVTATAVSVAVRPPGGPPAPDDPTPPIPLRGAAVRTQSVVVRSRITVRADAERYLDRLIAANEPPGRAGGVAIAGLFGAMLVERVEGSLSNVSGLPLRETLDLLADLGLKL